MAATPCRAVGDGDHSGGGRQCQWSAPDRPWPDFRSPVDPVQGNAVAGTRASGSTALPAAAVDP
jgi:hypothetical protein